MIEQLTNQINKGKFRLTTHDQRALVTPLYAIQEISKRAFSSVAGNAHFSGSKLPDPLPSFFGVINVIGYIVANLKGVFVKDLVIESPKLLPFLVLPINTFFAHGCGSQQPSAWLPPHHLLKAGFMSGNGHLQYGSSRVGFPQQTKGGQTCPC